MHGIICVIGIILVIIGLAVFVCAALECFSDPYADNRSDGVSAAAAAGFLSGISCTLGITMFALSVSDDSAYTPTALDVYRNKTELQITSVNGVPTDTVVVFKKTCK